MLEKFKESLGDKPATALAHKLIRVGYYVIALVIGMFVLGTTGLIDGMLSIYWMFVFIGVALAILVAALTAYGIAEKRGEYRRQ